MGEGPPWFPSPRAMLGGGGGGGGGGACWEIGGGAARKQRCRYESSSQGYCQPVKAADVLAACCISRLVTTCDKGQMFCEALTHMCLPRSSNLLWTTAGCGLRERPSLFWCALKCLKLDRHDRGCRLCTWVSPWSDRFVCCMRLCSLQMNLARPMQAAR